MKKIVLLLSLFLMLFAPDHMLAQEKAKTKIASVKLKGETVRFTLTSSKPFIVGGNRYILHIAQKDFFRYEQSDDEEKGTMTFFISADEFNKLDDGGSVYLTYGNIKTGTHDIEAMSKQSRRLWSLGKLNKNLLTK